MHRRPVIYIAGPYANPDPVENTNSAVRVGLAIRDRFNVGVVIPHTTLLAHAISPRPAAYWYEFDLDVLAVCDALVRIPGPSTGSDREVEGAHERQIPCFLLTDDGARMLLFGGGPSALDEFIRTVELR